MAQETIFSKIIRREIPADILYQDDLVTAFRDIRPRAPVHILLVPNQMNHCLNDDFHSTNLHLHIICLYEYLNTDFWCSKHNFR